jgi:hypothetical protein
MPLYFSFGQGMMDEGDTDEWEAEMKAKSGEQQGTKL